MYVVQFVLFYYYSGVRFFFLFSFSEGEEIPLSRSSSSNRDLDFESERAVPSAETPVGVLQEIAMKCGAKVMSEAAF